MTPLPVFHLLAGPNGAGKSTLYHALVADKIISPKLQFVNADLFERDHLQHIADPEQRSKAARDWVDAQRSTKLALDESFVSDSGGQTQDQCNYGGQAGQVFRYQPCCIRADIVELA